MHYPYFFIMLNLLADPWSPSLAPVSLNLLQSPICQNLHLMSTLVLSFVLFNASQLGIPVVWPVSLREIRFWISSQQGKLQFDAVLTNLMSNWPISEYYQHALFRWKEHLHHANPRRLLNYTYVVNVSSGHQPICPDESKCDSLCDVNSITRCIEVSTTPHNNINAEPNISE